MFDSLFFKKSLSLILSGPGYTDTFSNRSVFISLRFQIDPLWIAYSNVCIFVIVFIVLTGASVLIQPRAASKIGVLVVLLCNILQKQRCNFDKKDHFLLF